MSIQYKNYVTANVGTSSTTVYTASTQSSLIGLTLANTTTSTTEVDVTLTSGATTVYIIKGAAVKKSNTLEVVGDSRIVIESGDILKVRSSSASSVDVVVSTMEVL